MFAASKSGSVDAKDPQFNYVTMLLHGNGTNGAQNNTFVDSSTNNFTITRNGNTTQGTFSPYGSNWSNYFGGASDYLTMPDNANYVISGDFTVEAWIYPTSFAGTNGNIVLAQWPGSTATNQSFQFYVNSTGKVGLVYGIGATNAAVVGTSLSCTLNTWNHIAVTRSGTTVRYFVNGSVDSTTSTVSGAFNNSTGVMSVGRINASDSGYFSGYISNCRLVVGTALYTVAFTPSTTPLTAVSGTQVLVCQNNRFLDASSNNATITVGGSPSVQRFSPFSPTTAYSTSVIGGSGYFDGSGDSLSVATTTALSFGTGDFTIEGWVYKTAAANASFVDGRVNPGGAAPWAFYVDASNYPYFYDGSVYSSSVAISLNAWNHIVAVRTSGTLKIFVNGVQGYSAALSTNLDRSAGAFIGVSANTSSPSAYWQGYINDLRIVKGTAVYTAAFTPPTAPLTAITNTSLLLSYTNAGILDNAMMNDLETVGNAQISTSVKKYGTGSMYFDGAGDWVSCPASPQWLMAGDWTIECWIYPNSVTGVQVLVETRNRTTNASPCMYLNGTNLVIDTGTASVVSAGTITISTWQHVAATRSGNSWRIFINGTQVGSTTTNTTSYTTAYGCCIGSSYYNEHYNGYIDDLRITKGYARYTANFTAPTAAFPDKG